MSTKAKRVKARKVWAYPDSVQRSVRVQKVFSGYSVYHEKRGKWTSCYAILPADRASYEQMVEQMAKTLPVSRDARNNFDAQSENWDDYLGRVLGRVLKAQKVAARAALRAIGITQPKGGK